MDVLLLAYIVIGILLAVIAVAIKLREEKFIDKITDISERLRHENVAYDLLLYNEVSVIVSDKGYTLIRVSDNYYKVMVLDAIVTEGLLTKILYTLCLK